MTYPKPPTYLMAELRRPGELTQLPSFFSFLFRFFFSLQMSEFQFSLWPNNNLTVYRNHTFFIHSPAHAEFSGFNFLAFVTKASISMDVWAPLWGDPQSSAFRPRNGGAGLVAHENKERSQKDGYCWLRVDVCIGGQFIKLDRNTGDNKKVLSRGRGLHKGGYWERKETGWRYTGEEGRGGEEGKGEEQ